LGEGFPFEAKTYLSPASLEAAESAEKKRSFLGVVSKEGPNLCVPCGLCERKNFSFFSFFVDRILAPSYYPNWMSRMVVLGNI
jgi:hypothetical protein